MRAYILVRFASDADLSNARHALDRDGMQSVDLVMGPYDAIVTCEVSAFARLAEVAKAVSACPGIRDSLTCPVM